ncbi:MAG: hypothetical protein LBJ13_03475 [Puniceicoccales bacterium]|jgi:hypothetical protein|nr:hypothetical protein [Puniceicoccales bacterium]
MSEIIVDTSDTNTRTVQTESLPVDKKQPDARDVENFQALLSERVEGDQKKDSKRNSQNSEIEESGGNISVFTLLLGGKVESKKTETTSGRKEAKVEAVVDAKVDANEVTLVTEKFGAMSKKPETVPVKTETASGRGEAKVEAAVDAKVDADEAALVAEAFRAMSKKPETVPVKTETTSGWKEAKVEAAVDAKVDANEAALFTEDFGAMSKNPETVPVKTETASEQEDAAVDAKVDANEVAVVVDKEAVKSETIGVSMDLGGMSGNVSPGERILNALGQISDSKSIAHAETISKVGREISEYLAINSARQEAVIRFKGDVLPDTQASIIRQGSTVSITFETNNPQSREILNVGCNELQILVEQLKDVKRAYVKVETQESGDLGEKNSQKRQQNQQSGRENDENTH